VIDPDGHVGQFDQFVANLFKNGSWNAIYSMAGNGLMGAMEGGLALFQAQQAALTAKTTKGGPKGTVYQRQFILSNPSKKGGYIIQYVSAHWTAPDDQKIYWEAFRVKPGAISPKATWPEGGTDQFNGGLFSEITADAQFYEGLTPKELTSLFRDTGGKQVKESGSALSTNKDPHVTTPASSNILHVSWENLAN
jgi:hypothetical protein